MSAPLAFGLVLALFVPLHVAGWRIAEKFSSGARVAVGLASLAPCLPGVWFALYYLHFLPEGPLLYQLRSLSYGEGFLALFGFACGVWRSILPKLLKPVPTAAGIFLLAIPFLKPVFKPLDLSTLRDDWRDGACLQTSVVTCGPAAAAGILRQFGDEAITERDLAREAWTSTTGTEAWHLARALRRRGYQVRFLAPDGLPSRDDLPGILGSGRQRAGHFISLLEITDDEIHFIDPLSGRARMTPADFHKWIEFEPFFMSIRPASSTANSNARLPTE